MFVPVAGGAGFESHMMTECGAEEGRSYDRRVESGHEVFSQPERDNRVRIAEQKWLLEKSPVAPVCTSLISMGIYTRDNFPSRYLDS